MTARKFTLSKKLLKLRGKRRINVLTIVLLALTFGLIGSWLIFNSRAAGPFVSFEPESATRSGNIAVKSDSNASGGQLVEFGVAQQSGLFLNGFFPIGVDVQPSYLFSTWKDRGINSLIRVPSGSNIDTWATEASQAGLYQVREQRSNPAQDIGQQYLLAWAHQDEPDGIHSQVAYEEIQRRYNAWKQIDPTRNVLINFVGGVCGESLCQYDIRNGESGTDWYKKYVAGADWVSADNYPFNESSPDIANIGRMVDALKRMSGSKPVFAYIESSDFNYKCGGPGPTPDQLRGEVWSAIIHGVRGIWYFPVQVYIGPGCEVDFQFDVTPPAVADEMKRIHPVITSLGPVLQGEINPSSISATVPAPLEVGWRSAPSGKYFFVINLSGTSRSSQQISLSGVGSASSAAVYNESRNVTISNGVITDNFGPYAVHIYVVP